MIKYGIYYNHFLYFPLVNRGMGFIYCYINYVNDYTIQLSSYLHKY